MDSEKTRRDSEPGSTPSSAPDNAAATDMPGSHCDPADVDLHVDEINTTSSPEPWASTGSGNNPDLSLPSGRGEAAIQLASVLDLFGRMKLIEDYDGGWNGGDTVDALCEWFREFGIDIDADVIAAAQELHVPSWLASFINSQTLDTHSLVIHLSSDNTSCAELTRTQLTTLVRTLGEGTTAAVYDNPGEQILRVDHAELDPVMF